MKKCPRCFIPGCFDLRPAENLGLELRRRGLKLQIKFTERPKLALLCQMCGWFVIGVIEDDKFVITDTPVDTSERATSTRR